MAKKQSNKHDIKRARTKTTKKKQKVAKKKVFSLGFLSMSLAIAVMVFFACFMIGMEIGPSLI